MVHPNAQQKEESWQDYTVRSVIERNCLHRGKKDFTFLQRRQRISLYYIIKILYEIDIEKRKLIDTGGKFELLFNFKQITSGKLLKMLQNKSAEDLKDDHYGVLQKNAFTHLLSRIQGLFIEIQEISKKKRFEEGKGTYFRIKITKLGKKLYRRWREYIERRRNT